MKAQIRLRFNTSSGQPVVVVRSFQVSSFSEIYLHLNLNLWSFQVSEARGPP